MSFVNRITVCLVLLVALSSVALAQRQAERITEDDPRWDCRTMGNKICGPNAKKPAIYCGALTKKGTPCKRRVRKPGDHCYLHGGAK